MLQFQEIPEEYQRVWSRYAIAVANYELVDESKKSILALIASAEEWSEATRERVARQDQRYKDYLLKLQKARIDMETLKTELASINMQFEYYRSINANKRTEMRMI